MLLLEGLCEYYAATDFGISLVLFFDVSYQKELQLRTTEEQDVHSVVSDSDLELVRSGNSNNRHPHPSASTKEASTCQHLALLRTWMSAAAGGTV